MPVCGDNPRVLVLGSFPGRLSLLHDEYYGNPKNHFWTIMEALFEIDAGLPYSRRIEDAEKCGIALWDVVSSCSRRGSADARITSPVFNDIAGFALAHPTLQLIALNGSTAGRFYTRAGPDISVPSVVLPSTSPANAAMTVDEKIRRWSVLKKKE